MGDNAADTRMLFALSGADAMSRRWLLKAARENGALILRRGKGATATRKAWRRECYSAGRCYIAATAYAGRILLETDTDPATRARRGCTRISDEARSRVVEILRPVVLQGSMGAFTRAQVASGSVESVIPALVAVFNAPETYPVEDWPTRRGGSVNS